MKYKTYKNENKRVSIWNSGHEARVTAGPLHEIHPQPFPVEGRGPQSSGLRCEIGVEQHAFMKGVVFKIVR